jgi:uncharacterized protein
MAIDLHTHFVPAPLAEALRERRLAPWIGPDESGGERLHMPVGTLAFTTDYVDMGARIAFMDELGIERQVLSFPGLFGLDSRPAEEALPLLRLFNDEVAALAGHHPTRFSGLAALPIADIDAAVAEYRRAREALGLIGAILPNNAFTSLAEAERMRPLFAIAQEIGGHLFIHPGRRPDQVPPPAGDHTTAPFADSVVARQALAIQHVVAQAMATFLFTDFLDDYPKVGLHVANLGGTLPMVVERMDNVVRQRAIGTELPSTRLKRVHVDCSSLGPRALEIAVAAYGAGNIVLGTDCPIFDTAASLAAIDAARITDEDREAIRRGNALRLIGRWLG